MTRKALALLISLAFLVTSVPDAVAAPTRSGGGGGTRSGGSSGGSSGGRSTRPPTGGGTKTSSRTQTTAKSSTGRNTKAPTGGTKTTTKSSSGRSTKAPTRTGSRVVKSTVRNTTQPSKGAITISKDTVAGGKSYKVPGTNKTYVYNRTVYRGYYSSYGGGYPSYGSALYWTLWNDPFYYPNYLTVGSPWYGHPTPVGYQVVDGQLISRRRPFPWLKLFVVLVVIAAAVGAVAFALDRRRRAAATRPYGFR